VAPTSLGGPSGPPRHTVRDSFAGRPGHHPGAGRLDRRWTRRWIGGERVRYKTGHVEPERTTAATGSSPEQDGHVYWFRPEPSAWVRLPVTQTATNAPGRCRFTRPHPAHPLHNATLESHVPRPGAGTWNDSPILTATTIPLLLHGDQTTTTDNGSTATAAYTQAGALSKIRYGLRTSSFRHPRRPEVNFTVAPRGPTSPLDLTGAANASCDVSRPPSGLVRTAHFYQARMPPPQRPSAPATVDSLGPEPTYPVHLGRDSSTPPCGCRRHPSKKHKGITEWRYQRRLSRHTGPGGTNQRQE